MMHTTLRFNPKLLAIIVIVAAASLDVVLSSAPDGGTTNTLVMTPLLRNNLGLQQQNEDVDHFNKALCWSESCSDTQFCGVDGQCHNYSCDAWYTLGPRFFTRYEEDASEALTCHDNNDDDDGDRSYWNRAPLCGDDWPVAVEFFKTSHGAILSRMCPIDNVPSISYRRKCTARPTHNTTLVCYDMGTSSSSDSISFAAINNDAVGKHVYSLYVMGPGYYYFLPLGESSSNRTELNITVLQSSMYSELSESYQPPDLERPIGSFFDYCEPGGCRISEFCGRDKVCHSIDCDNLYQYGPEGMAGAQDDPDSHPEQYQCTMQHSNNDADLLTTSTSAAKSNNDTSLMINAPPTPVCDDGAWPIALEYRCSLRNSGSSAFTLCPQNSNSNGRMLSFARRCTGQPNPDQTFVCYDMKGVSSLAEYAANYVNLVSTNSTCTMDDNQIKWMDKEVQSWPMCRRGDWTTSECRTARHIMMNRVNGPSFINTNIYWHEMSEDAFMNELSLEALDNAIYSKLTGMRPDKPDSNADGIGTENGSHGALLSPISSGIAIAIGSFFVSSVW